MDDTAPLELVLVDPRVGNDVVTTRETQFHVDLNFSCDLIVCEYYDNVVLRHTVQLSFMSESVRMDIKQLMDPENSHRMIGWKLGQWPLDDHNRRKLSKFAFIVAKDLMRFMPPQHNVLIIPVNVLVECNRHVDENLAMELMAQLSEEEDDSEIVPVPASDSSMDESLEIKTATLLENEVESCSICLEDFYTGCEVLSMPCSHIFHEDCIRKWLKTSHNCPICRFEMPTAGYY